MTASHRALFIAVFLSLLSSSAMAAAPQISMTTLRNFFHGAPAAPPKAPPPKQLAAVSTAVGVMPDAAVENFLRALAAAIQARDGKPMLKRLADRYTIDDLPAGKQAGELFEQAVERIAGPTEMIVTSVESQKDVRIARVEMRYGAGPAKQKIFRFNPSGQLLWSDLFRLQVQSHGM